MHRRKARHAGLIYFETGAPGTAGIAGALGAAGIDAALGADVAPGKDGTAVSLGAAGTAGADCVKFCITPVSWPLVPRVET